jgi:SAM-dependent methyltransferase
MDERLHRIRNAYDLTVEQYDHDIDPLGQVPLELRESAAFQTFIEDASRSCNSGAPENKEFLEPEAGMCFLDVGSGASLANYRLDLWPSKYFGIDISRALIQAMHKFSIDHGASIGGLHVAELADLPFADDVFGIAATIGVLEYCTMEYAKRGLSELQRVLKPHARMVLDIPNLDHPHVDIMFRLEDHLNRPQVPHSRSAFESVLLSHFSIDRVDDAHVMVKYFCSTG